MSIYVPNDRESVIYIFDLRTQTKITEFLTELL